MSEQVIDFSRSRRGGASQDKEAKKALETAVSKIAKAYNEILKVAEKHGDHIDKEDYAKARFYLDQTISKLWDKVDVVRDIAKATAGEFSLDSVEMPEYEEMPYITNAGVQTTMRVPKGLFKKPDHGPEIVQPIAPELSRRIASNTSIGALGGRMSKHAAREEPGKAAPRQSVKIDSQADDDNEVDFIDE